MSQEPDERRVHPRVYRQIELEGSHGGHTARLVAKNLSLGGLYCTSDRDFPEMTRLGVRLLLPARSGDVAPGDPLDIDAVVVRAQPASNGNGAFELALLFPALNAYQRDRLARFLS